MPLTALDAALEGMPRRRVLVVSDRYPPDAGGGAERSLHLMLREPALRDEVLVVAFHKALDTPVRRLVDGVETLSLPAPAAFPLDGLSQAEADRLKMRRLGLKWPAFAAAALRGPGGVERLGAIALQLANRPAGGVAADHLTVARGHAERAVRRIVDHVGPELVHADNARAIMVAAGALEGSGVPWVAVVRDHRFTTSRFDQTADAGAPGDARWSSRAADGYASRSLAFRRACLARARTVLVAGAHIESELAAFLPAGRLVRHALTPVTPASASAPPDAGFNVLIVGSVTPNKGQEHFLDAWPDVLAKVPGAVLNIAGDGPSVHALRERVTALGLETSVHLHGHVDGDALSALYAGCHVVALPTLWSEPFGRVPLEAGAVGRPVVAYAVGGHVETVVDGVTGRLVSPQDRPGFVAALVGLACDTAARTRMGEANRARSQRFAPQRLADELAEAWRAAKRPGRSAKVQ